MISPLDYIGAPSEVEHHARPLASAFDVRIVAADEVVRLAQPGELCVFFNEYYPRFRDACVELKAKGCPTLYAIDGILEWRNSWELPEYSHSCLWVMRPALCHKVACIGRSQVRVLESWGNLGKCEVVGVPRFDRLGGRQPRKRGPDDPFRVLVITAKCPGFNPEQIACTTRSLQELKSWFEAHPRLVETQVEPVWRLTSGLAETIGVANQLTDTTGTDLATALESVDAVISTPSTAMLEGMLHGIPVALLDFHNRPHYVPAAWQITSAAQISDVLAQLAAPPPSRMLYQASILHDALECHEPATPRLVELLLRMRDIAQTCLRQGTPLHFPRRILPDPQDGHHLPEPSYDHQALFPERLLLTGSGRRLPYEQSVAAALREGLDLSIATTPLPKGDEPECDAIAPHVPSRFGWQDVGQVLDAERQRAVRTATRALEAELRTAKLEIAELKRQSLQARLARLGAKIGRRLGWTSARRKAA